MAKGGIGSGGQVFEIEHHGDTVVVIPQADLGEFASQQIEEGARAVLDPLEKMVAKHVVVDFHKTDYYGSTALAFFVKVWTRVRKRAGQMAFCNVSAHEKEILSLTELGKLWPICDTRSEALAMVRK